MKISKSQLALFFRSLSKACDELGIEDREAYRKRIIKEETGRDSLTEVNATDQFDRLMSRVSEDAGDFEAAIRYQGATTNRWRRAISERVKTLLSMSGTYLPGKVESYVAGIVFQGHLVNTTLTQTQYAERLKADNGWDDLDPRALRIIYQIVKCEIERRRKEAS